MSYNPFQNADLVFPKRYHQDFVRFTQSQEGADRRSVDHSPIPRFVDLWFLGLCQGALKGEEAEIDVPHKFHTGAVFASDPYRVDLIELIAIAHTGDPWVIDDSTRVIRLANRLAAAGIPETLAMLEDGKAEPIWNLSDNLERLLTQQHIASNVEADLAAERIGGLSSAEPI